MLNSGNPRIPGPATDTRCRYLEQTCPTRGQSNRPFSSFRLDFFFVPSLLFFERQLRACGKKSRRMKSEKDEGEIEGLKFGEFSIRSEVFEEPSRSLYSSPVQGNRIFWAKREPPLLSGSIREFWKNDTPESQGEPYLRIFAYLSWHFIEPYSRKKAEPTNSFRETVS